MVAKLEGSDPPSRTRRSIYTAHWDHLGRDPALSGDQIFNGAADNASGVAADARNCPRVGQVVPPPKRSIIFLAVTAEEKGLLGAKYYASHPLYPLERTLADINLDVINLWGPTKDLITIGMGNSTLDDMLVEIAKRYGRTVGPDANPEKGYYFRSDHFEFAKQGVPALDPKGGREYIGKSADFGQKKLDEYTANDYHKVSDEVKPDWDLNGAARMPSCWSSWVIESPRRKNTPNGSLPASSAPSERRCSRRPNHEGSGGGRVMRGTYGRWVSLALVVAAVAVAAPPGWIFGTVGSLRPSTPSRTVLRSSPCGRSGGRLNSCSSAPIWPSLRCCSSSASCGWPARAATGGGGSRYSRWDIRFARSCGFAGAIYRLCRAIAAIALKSRRRCSRVRGR